MYFSLDGSKEDASEENENLEMLRALYDFKATIEQTLDFSRNDYFVLTSTSNKERNWWHVVNCEGRIGYIPSNYVETITVSLQKLFFYSILFNFFHRIFELNILTAIFCLFFSLEK